MPLAKPLKAIFIDAGHGRNADDIADDNGASGNGTTERDEVVKIARAVVRVLRSQPALNGIDIIGNGIDERLSITQHSANVNAVCKKNKWTEAETLCISIHLNSGGGTGTESWFENKNVESEKLAVEIAESIASGTTLKNRGAKNETTNRLGSLMMCSGVTPTSILIEVGFIDSAEDIKEIQAEDSKVTKQIVKGILDYLLMPFTPPNQDFSDVADDRWSAAAIKKVKKAGIMVGYNDGTFKPGMPVTREELATVIVRMLNL